MKEVCILCTRRKNGFFILFPFCAVGFSISDIIIPGLLIFDSVVYSRTRGVLGGA